MIQAMIDGNAIRCVAARPLLRLALAALFGLLPAAAFAHDFGVGKGAYEDFLNGNVAVLADVPVLMAVIAAGILAGIWKPEGFPSLWPSFFVGLLVGTVLGFVAAPPASLPTYIAVILIGLLGAAALDLSVGIMRGIFFLIGAVLTNAIFSGHTVSEIPVFAYIGIAVALNFCIAAAARIVMLSRERLQYGWVMIVWRAGMSWFVAIAVMAMTLMLKTQS